MGSVDTITAKTFPKQGAYAHWRTRVCFHFGRDEVMGTIVRDDVEEPFRTIIQLDDGRYVLSTECQYSLVAASRPPEEP